MWVYLIFEPSQFGLSVLGFLVFQLLFDLSDAHKVAYADGDSAHKAVEQHKHQHACKDTYPHVWCHRYLMRNAVTMEP